MRYFINLKIQKIYLIVFIYFFNFISFCNAEIYKEIIVTGNKRLNAETVIMFSGLKAGIDLTTDDLNVSIKNLFKTDYFKDIEFEILNGTLEIKIKENPIIQSIVINGIKNKSLIKAVNDVTKRSERYPFLKNNLQEQKNLLLNIVRSSGFYFSELKTRIIDNQNNTVDVIYDFELGERAIIKNINFQGNKVFKDSKLRNVIKSEEGKFWKFITSDKYLNESIIKQDENLLRKYFKNKGYYNVDIKSSYAKNINNEYFELNYNIDAGEKYFFNKIILDIGDSYDPTNFKNIEKKNKKTWK